MDTTNKLAEAERPKFEAYIRKDCGDLSTFGYGANMHYRNSAVNNAWLGWLERAKLATRSADQATQPAEAVAWLNEAHIASAKADREAGRNDLHTWSEQRTAFHRVPVYTHPAPLQAMADNERELGLDYGLGASASEPRPPMTRIAGVSAGVLERAAKANANFRASVAGAGEALELPGEIESAIQLVIAAACNWGSTDGETRKRVADLRAKICSALAARPVAEEDDSVGSTREQWVSHAARVYRACGDTEAEAAKLAEALADEQDWHGELDEPFEMALADIEGRPVADGEARINYEPAPAPLSQAVPEGFWLAPMQADTEMLEAYLSVSEKFMSARTDWNAMRDSWLARHPQPQAVTEDARDGERFAYLPGRVKCSLKCGSLRIMLDDTSGIDEWRYAIDRARAATGGSEGEGRG